ncbi:hypothetical protein [Pseudoalteromonas aurantia]|uniref:Uncharacterized protein n=1 Tax=Pseudoalteromonas aurantia 208 TaxID=1314867 RepID=A0ABR9EEJ3_9GAMM|nr:hypothetical protein [Pseudoalteromonas aurantia]MBE0369381.1 hypothetical protein [Pseudoalteromonas aurantia 208]
MKDRQKGKIQPQWLWKTLISLVLGLTLSFGLVGLFAWFGPDSLNSELSGERLLWKTQIHMWMVPPIWMIIVTVGYLFKTAKEAAMSLLIGNVCVFGCLIFFKDLL